MKKRITPLWVIIGMASLIAVAAAMFTGCGQGNYQEEMTKVQAVIAQLQAELKSLPEPETALQKHVLEKIAANLSIADSIVRDRYQVKPKEMIYVTAIIRDCLAEFPEGMKAYAQLRE